MKYDQSKNSQTASGQSQGGQRNFGGRRGAGGANGSMVNGQIIAKDDKSITVKSNNNGSKIVFIAPSTQISESVIGTSTDLAVGKDVVVNGANNSDGSVTGQFIQIRLPMPNNPGGSNTPAAQNNQNKP